MTAAVGYRSGPPAWGPLEGFAASLKGPVVSGEFMWMCRVELVDGTRVDEYEHIDTRRYLRLDAAGHAYGWWPDSGDYFIVDTPWEAIDELYPTATAPAFPRPCGSPRSSPSFEFGV